MRPKNELGPAEREIEEALSRLRLPGATIDRDRLMYEAGRRSIGGHLLAWRAFSLLLAVGIGLLWTIRPVPSPREPLVYVDAGTQQMLTASPPVEQPGPVSLGVYRKVLSEGPDALPDVRGGISATTSERLTLRQLLCDSSRGI